MSHHQGEQMLLDGNRNDPNGYDLGFSILQRLHSTGGWKQAGQISFKKLLPVELVPVGGRVYLGVR